MIAGFIKLIKSIREDLPPDVEIASGRQVEVLHLLPGVVPGRFLSGGLIHGEVA